MGEPEMKRFIDLLDTPGGHIAVLVGFTLTGIVVYIATREKWLAELFAAPMLLGMRGAQKP